VQPTAQKIEPTPPAGLRPVPPQKATRNADKTPQHKINKKAVIVGVVGFSALLFMAWR